ncbi:MAG: xanthine dehydrogenase family protein subunit M [Chloroflexi bacterium]|nr:xanthine dehydrogenase family protein subunit M [Chloroflexota bacterium]
MYTPDFHYHKAGSVAEAVEMLGHHEDSRLLAGGHSLLPLMRLRLARPATLIDIGGLDELRGIRVHDGHIHIGALTTHGEIARSHDVQHANPLVAEVAGGIGDTQVRNRGTIGGNLAHADPASDWGTIITVMEGSVDVQGPNGSRTIGIADFFQGAFETAVADDEIITGVRVPTLVRQGNGHGHEHGQDHGHDHGHDHGAESISGEVGEYAKMSHPASFYPVIGGAVVINADGGRCVSARVAVGGLVPTPRRAPSVEAALAGQELTAGNLEAAANQLSNDLGDEIIGDVFASADYRRAIAPVEVKHAMLHAIGLAHH